jgi:Cytochrome c3
MKNKNIIYIFLSFFFIFTNYGLFSQSKDECFNCHNDLDDQVAISYKTDVHFQKGISCSGCHGGKSSSDDQDIAMSNENGFIGVPSRNDRYKVCVKCHSDQNRIKSFGSDLRTDQFEKLQNSVHFQPTYNSQGPIADCITCHSIHNIKRVNDPTSTVYPTRIIALCGKCHSDASYMKNYNPGLPVDQVAKYKTSIHGMQNAKGDPNVAECASCHGHHDIMAVSDPRSHVYATNIPSVCANCHGNSKLMSTYNLPSDQYEGYVKSVHGVALLQNGDLSAPSCNDCHGNHGAVPPGVESISKVCGSCHVLNMELFEQSPHKTAFDENDFPECETCHSNHLIVHPTDNMLGTGKFSVCMDCHSNNGDDNGYIVADSMSNKIDSLKTLEEETQKILKEAGQKGMDVSDATYSLKDVRQILIQSRTMVHSFNLDKFDEKIIPGFEIVNKAMLSGNEAVDEYYYRRIGLGFATIIVTLLVIGLYIKLKRVENKS